MKVLELFAGSRSIGKMADRMGWECYSSDINDFEGIDYVVNVLEFDVDKVPFKPDIIWASPHHAHRLVWLVLGGIGSPINSVGHNPGVNQLNWVSN